MYQLSSTSLEEIRQWVSNGFHISDTLKLIFFALKNDVEREKNIKKNGKLESATWIQGIFNAYSS